MKLGRLIWVGRSSCGHVNMISTCPTTTLAELGSAQDRADEWRDFYQTFVGFAKHGSIEVYSGDDPEIPSPAFCTCKDQKP